MVDLRPHWSFLGTPLAVALVVLALGITLDVALPHTSVLWHWVEGVVVAVPLAWLGLRTLEWMRNRLVLTSDRLVRTWGVARRHRFETSLARIEEVGVRQTTLERLLGSGRVEVARWGEPDEWVLEFVRRPEVFQRLVHRRIPPSGGAAS